ncbi:metal-dependent hydrolase family protein [Bifidobacterium crudilactis]|uniref:metal-dependent hydrolase family protein n=1 Tax=Bifidobacterium crudilactis TaxID=327277 RepID=UPI00264848AF|nr:amidohydrolase family protein [Bifidobacterium crudilactis]MDN6209144.1 amidohydrolase family protein [Bifidobacterium crudilactis]
MNASFAIGNVNIVNERAGDGLLRGYNVVVDGKGTITAVGPRDTTTIPEGCHRVDGRGKYLLPGLINAHVHLFSDGKPLPELLTGATFQHAVSSVLHSPIGTVLSRRRAQVNARTLLLSGVTTFRTVGDVGYEAVALQRRFDSGKELGARMLASGPLLAITGGHGSPQIAMIGDSPWQARKNTRINIMNGVSAIKIAATGGVTDARKIGDAGRPQMSEEEMAAVCMEAHQAGLLVAAHAQSAQGVTMALRAGVDTIEHGCAMNDEIVDLFHDNPLSLRGWSALIPTLSAALPLVKLDQDVTGVSDIVIANAHIAVAEMIQGIHDAKAHGIAIGMGTDTGMTLVTQYNSWRELALLQRFGGLTPIEAIHAATWENARILGLDGITGQIGKGFSADMLLLAENPLLDLGSFVHPELVVTRGTVLKNPRVQRFDDIDTELDAMLV